MYITYTKIKKYSFIYMHMHLYAYIKIYRNFFLILSDQLFFACHTKKLKINIYKATVLTILLYACSPGIDGNLTDRINSFGTSCLKHISGIKWQKKVSNQYVYNINGENCLVGEVYKPQLRFLGRIPTEVSRQTQS